MIKNNLKAWRRSARKALRKASGQKTAPNGVVLYEGPSQLDGEPIVVIATGTARASSNEKTGDMIQIWILPRDESPVDAVREGRDVSVCGDCKHRPSLGGSCYVAVFQGPRAVWSAYKAGRYVRIADVEGGSEAFFAGSRVRMGAWGDPYAVPLEVFQPIVSGARSFTGYSHQWASMAPAVAEKWQQILMASVDTAAEYFKAKASGWRCFLVHDEDKAPVGRVCPAAPEAPTVGKIDCAACGACAGLSSGAKRPDVAIRVHGAKAGRFSDYAGF